MQCRAAPLKDDDDDATSSMVGRLCISSLYTDGEKITSPVEECWNAIYLLVKSCYAKSLAIQQEGGGDDDDDGGVD